MVLGDANDWRLVSKVRTNAPSRPNVHTYDDVLAFAYDGLCPVGAQPMMARFGGLHAWRPPPSHERLELVD